MNSTSNSTLHKVALLVAFALGLAAILWVGAGFVGTSHIALAMTFAIAVAYLAGALEVRRYRSLTNGLATALAQVPEPLHQLGDWLPSVPQALQHAVRQRIEGERAALPGLSITPYLIGLLVMLGMLGTFLGMVVTFKGAVFALEGSADLAAIRSALAAPIKGLGFAFGTSVAGVATSAMLGLMSALSRRERLEVVRVLDARIATVFHPFTLAFQRNASFAAMQAQASALPAVVDQLQALMTQMEQRGQQLDTQLVSRQDQFHKETAAAYTGLGQTVALSLQESLTASARIAGETIQPVVESAMKAIAEESTRLHGQVSESVQAQLKGLSSEFSATTGAVADTWKQALDTQAHTNTELVSGLGLALVGFNETLEQRSQALLGNVSEAMGRQQSEQALAEQNKQAAWALTLQSQAAASEAMVGQLSETLAGFSNTFEQRTSALLSSMGDAMERVRREQAEAEQGKQAAWLQTLQSQAMGSEQMVARLGEALTGFSDSFEQRASALLANVGQAMNQSQADHAQAEQQKQATWTQALQTMAAGLQSEWQTVGSQNLAQQQAVGQALAQAAAAIQQSATEQARQTQEEMSRLLATSEALVQARSEAEAQWAAEQGERMDQLAGLWRSELAALRTEESARGESAVSRLADWQDGLTTQLQTLRREEDQRGEAAVNRLGELQTAMASHLATLGEALEAPMTRLLETASEAPKAAAEVIAQLRQEMSHLTERDNLALQERTALVGNLGTLLQSVEHATGEQRAAIESLVTSATSVLDQVSQQFSATLETQASNTNEVAAQVAGSAAELASLGEAFHHGVQLFSESNQKLVDKLQNIEGAISQNMARSDEQLAYYVAQAREVIDLSISSQQGIVEDLRRLRGSSAKAAAGGSAA
ncbi:hypothetical protein LPB72_06365 [Hydrogenophaga crassostreae]|uniref:DUF802 domain-containing protein n=1 Tax=Hydrogenophaga crassostreae TaxID=1763535 RepID=A0A167IIU2_9BURK|nr:DUF802 domain-containing protein [Hydrogenophaga crassostreae]AOW14175.1 hypothetical protein LPB072_16350 [Hydrogenophaga crassostreae]OAD42895.1 hypothetical protein LPB72_06365 [Hydrogenophaga crassostreae]